MEDAHICNTNLGAGMALFGVFDGHGGQEVALYVKKYYAKILSNLPAFKMRNYRLALEESFLKMDEQMLTEQGQKELFKMNKSREDMYSSEQKSYAGCTATVVLITQSEIYCCNAGDSRTVLSKNKQAVDLSKDHKPDDADERRRIYNASSYVEDSRVNGSLALSRALGDFDYKNNTMLKAKDQAVTAFPDVRCN